MKWIIRIVLASVAYLFALSLSGQISRRLNLPVMPTPAGVSLHDLFVGSLIATPLLMASLAPLASGLGGSWIKRWMSLALLMFMSLGLTTVIELLAFTNVSGTVWTSQFFALPALVAAAVMTPARAGESVAAPAQFGTAGWMWRLCVAWLAFPLIYIVFGMMVAPFVLGHYNAGVLGLRIPSPGVILRTVLVRSALFLVSVLPIARLWTKSRAHLFAALGLALAMMVGIFGLLQAFWYPMILRMAHSIEITADEFAYAAVLVLLFTKKSTASEPAEQVAKLEAA